MQQEGCVASEGGVPPPDERGRHAAEPSAHPPQAQHHVTQGQGPQGGKGIISKFYSSKFDVYFGF